MNEEGSAQWPAGWYPDANQPGTQRYWNGHEWTEQTAPLATGRPDVRTATLGIAAVGAVLAIVGAFLPKVESDEFLRVADNSMVQSGDGLIVIGVAIGGLAAIYGKRTRPAASLGAILAGVVIVGLAIYNGSGERLELESAAGGIFSNSETASAGVGIWATGAGGAILAFAGLRSGPD